MKHPQRFPFFVYNFAPPDPRHGRDMVHLHPEVLALTNSAPRDRRRSNPKLGFCTETIGWGDVDVTGMKVIQSRKTPGRANLRLYVAAHLEVSDVEWVQCEKDWPRTQHGGRHDPRAILRCRVEDTRVIVGHGPPDVPGADEARREWVRVTAGLCEGDVDVLLGGDPNELLDDVLRLVGDPKACIAGTGTDAVYARGFRFEGIQAPAVVNGVHLGSDHQKALLGRAVRR